MPEQNTEVSGSRRIISIILCVLFAILLWANIVPQVGHAYTTDSYAYILLGRSIFEHGTFATNAIRDFYGTHTIPQFSRSFPPGYPAVVGLMDFVRGSGIASGPLVNAFAITCSIAVAWWLSKLTTARAGIWIAATLVVFMLTSAEYRDEVAAGRAYPLTFLLFLLSLVAAVASLRRREWLVRCAVAMAACLSLMVLVRFDQLLIAGALAAVAMIAWGLTYGIANSRRAMIALAVVGVVVFAPWGIRNMQVYGTPFASDNSMTAISTHGGGNLASRFYAPGKQPETIREVPRLWLQQRVGYFVRNTKGALKQAMWWIIPLVVLLPLVARKLDTAQKVFAAILVVHAAVTVFTVSTVPYRDTRYLTPVAFDAALLLGLFASIAIGQLKGLHIVRAESALAGVVLVALMAGAIVRRPRDEPYQWIPRPTRGAEDFESKLPQLQRMVSPGDLVAVPDAEHLTYATGIPGIHLPRNVKMNDAHFHAWLAAWQPRWVLAPNAWVQSMQLETWNTPAFTDSAWRLLRVPDSLTAPTTR